MTWWFVASSSVLLEQRKHSTDERPSGPGIVRIWKQMHGSYVLFVSKTIVGLNFLFRFQFVLDFGHRGQSCVSVSPMCAKVELQL